MAAFSANGKPSARGKSPHHTSGADSPFAEGKGGSRREMKSAEVRLRTTDYGTEGEGGKAGSRSRMKSPLPLSLGRAFSNSPRGEVVHHAHRAEFWTVNNFLGERNGALI
jgi:hypothetical protein